MKAPRAHIMYIHVVCLQFQVASSSIDFYSTKKSFFICWFCFFQVVSFIASRKNIYRIFKIFLFDRNIDAAIFTYKEQFNEYP